MATRLSRDERGWLGAVLSKRGESDRWRNDATPEFSSLFRIADFAYSSTSTLLLQRCDDASIESRNGVRQGDPLACLLFCVYMRELYAELAAEADVELFGFVDDLHIVGSPTEVIKA
jgi:hypothetical protein